MKNGFKRVLTTFLVATLLVACTSKKASVSLKAGTYSASAKGKNGNVTVEVEFDTSSIKSVKVKQQQETPDIAAGALKKIPEEIVKKQSVEVDTVSGATITSNAIINAVKDTVKQAGGSDDTFTGKQSATKKETQKYEADIVIVGAGAAGLSAALRATQAGVKVLVVEKASSIGFSNGAIAGGPAMAANKVQAAEKQEVSVETLFKKQYAWSRGTVNALLLKKVVEEGGPLIDDMVKMGLKATLRPDNYGAGFRARLKLEEKGEGRFKFIQNYVEKQGGKFLFNTTGEHVVLNDKGIVTGIKGKTSTGAPVEVKAKAVLLSTGGYLGNKKLLAEKFGHVGVVPLGSTLSTGDGLAMAKEAGGVEEKNSFSLIFNEFAGENEKSEGWRKNDNLKYAIYGGLLVNGNGDRFMNEEIMATKPLAGGEETLRQGYFYSIIDQDYLNGMSSVGVYEYLGKPEGWYVGKMTQKGKVLKAKGEQLDKAIKQGWAFKADTIEELAKKVNMPNLTKTVNTYNKMATNKKDTMFYKSSYFMTPVSKGPFYAFQYQSSAWGTLGGVKVDDQLRVIKADFKAIPGLYAAGVDAGSAFTTPYYDNEGAAFGTSLSSGGLAGKEMAKYVKEVK
ncbi:MULTISPECIES: FAD-dependent oxidoreductase [Terrabacteria group]|uniref:FAD-dependent oxidoreductase n=1 Tax=Bacillati TaxID=1783272 RepID=UPI001C6EA85E|nr:MULTISPECIES: FAD-dependent oxidoreductase [Terrabacteria group]MBW9212150.1 FAD-dependent oxidoreductase [Trueperella sp. zg.1013]